MEEGGMVGMVGVAVEAVGAGMEEGEKCGMRRKRRV
jgi:hypothetical protein